ncbi:glutaredoxin family protein [Veronia pacifica]|uniref:NrdH-redoxin n=1 Tax=Veronia pacifica TaxID=1080227 RepID=A0A1C3EBN4_9GAMM|nr:glutaredoxin family protein [Veronia pacifica]ODA30677.1 NrdH-redoxin [Veronia pacifica]
MALVLYSTEGCHLCELAHQIYQAVDSSTAIQVRDIAFDDHLFERYGVTIPVISYQKNGEIIDELFWPFDESGLINWLKTHGIN